MADALGTPLVIDHIDRSHRVGSRVNKDGTPRSTPKAIIVKFSSYRYRQRLFNARKLAKVNGYKDVYVNEDLTKFRNDLLYQARKLVKSKCLLGAWSADGTILIRDENKTVHRVMSESDLLPFQTTVPLVLSSME